MHALDQLLALLGLFSVAATVPLRVLGVLGQSGGAKQFVWLTEGRSRHRSPSPWAHCSGERCQGDCVLEPVWYQSLRSNL